MHRERDASVLPDEFDPEVIAARSAPERQMYRAEVTSREPMASVMEHNPEIRRVVPPTSGRWGDWEFEPGAYYDTTTGAKHSYWRDQDLPEPTRDIDRLRRDMLRWGYCKIEGAVSADQVAAIRQRVLDQAEGERLAGIQQRTPSGQNVNTCVNKGRCFEQLIELDPGVVQAGPLVEQLVTEALGPNWICTSLIGSISMKGGMPQFLHQDQQNAPGSLSPMTNNVLTVITDIDERNGGTLLIPGSHLALSEAVRENRPVGRLPPAINLDAQAGTVVITDGRLLHGTGINHTDSPRIVMLLGLQKQWMRQQENWMLSVRGEVLRRASPKLLQRMGFQASAIGGQTNEGFGYAAGGVAGERAGATVGFRLAADRGEYVRVGELGPGSTEEELHAAFTLRDVMGTSG